MEEIGKALLEIVIPALGMVVLALTAYGIPKLFKRWGLDMSASQRELLASLSRKAIGYASEYAAKKAEVDADYMDGAAKLRIAVAFLERHFPDLTPTELDEAIHAEIAFIDGVGASKPALGSPEPIVAISADGSMSGPLTVILGATEEAVEEEAVEEEAE